MVYSFLKFLPEGKTVSKEKNRKYNSQRERERGICPQVTLSLSLSQKKTKPERETDRKRQTGRESEFKNNLPYHQISITFWTSSLETRHSSNRGRRKHNRAPTWTEHSSCSLTAFTSLLSPPVCLQPAARLWLLQLTREITKIHTTTQNWVYVRTSVFIQWSTTRVVDITATHHVMYVCGSCFPSGNKHFHCRLIYNCLI